MNISNIQQWHNAMTALHCEPSQYEIAAQRKRDLVSKMYTDWSDSHPNHSKRVGRIKYRLICDHVYK